jgi:hypothetical protein
MKVEALRAKPVNNLANPRAKHAVTAWIISMPILDLCRDWSVMWVGGRPFLCWLYAASAGKNNKKNALTLGWRFPRPETCGLRGSGGAWKRKGLTGKHRQTHDFS